VSIKRDVRAECRPPRAGALNPAIGHCVRLGGARAAAGAGAAGRAPPKGMAERISRRPVTVLYETLDDMPHFETLFVMCA
jgi:hypothetical protein